MAAELAALEKHAEDGIAAFLSHIYKVHPPAKQGATLGAIDASKLQKTTQKALSHYHPDSQPAEMDEKSKFLCLEITKILNAKYAQLKMSS
ncbi:hypothetical protein I4U23_027222 [Adineta vaga]|nr:hypothetical protein I4U23_027222 [Adineta vaga]